MRAERGVFVFIVLALFVGGLLYLLAPILTPFVLSALLAYLGDPVADRLERWGLPRALAVTTVFAVIITLLLALLLVLVPLLERQVVALFARLPAYLEWLQGVALPLLREWLGVDQPLLDPSLLKELIGPNWLQAGGLAAYVLGSISRSSAAVLNLLVDVLLVPVVTFYLLRDWDILVAKVRALLPRRVVPVVSKLAAESDEVLGAFLRGQLTVMSALGLVYALGLWLVGLEFALLIGILAGLVSFVPYLGFIFGLGLASLAALLQFQEPGPLLAVLAVFGAGQLLESLLLTPLLVGDRIGLHPVAVMFAVLAGGQLFGFFGVLLALPAAAVIMVLLRHSHDEYLKSAFYGEVADDDGRASPAREP